MAELSVSYSTLSSTSRGFAKHPPSHEVSSNPLSSQSYIFDPRPNYPLLITAKRYWNPTSKYLDDPSALTLVLTHGSGFHKEVWEPTIDDFYTLLRNDHSSLRIREVWSIDSPDHGDAAVLNEHHLKNAYVPVFGWEEYARAIYSFLTNFGMGVDVDFSTRRLVGIGHSLGAGSLLLSLGYSPKLKFESLILIEPLSCSAEFIHKASEMLCNGALKRRDIWPSYEECYRALKSRPGCKAWDDRVLKLFVKHGMRPLPTAEYPDRRDGVTLKCTRKQEAANSVDGLGVYRSYNALGTVSRRLPVHLMYGSINDYLPQGAKDDVLDVAVGGVEHLASFTRIKGAGHLAVHMNPTGLARKIYEALILSHRSIAKL